MSRAAKKGNVMSSYFFNREEKEHVIRMLADHYPKCFSVVPQQRRPLKKNIAADLHVDGFPAAPELTAAAVEWYKSHFAYHHHLEAGARRVGLNGEDAGTVTELEAQNAQKYIRERKLKMQDKRAELSVPGTPEDGGHHARQAVDEDEREQAPAIATMIALRKSGRVPDDALRKIDAPLERRQTNGSDPVARLKYRLDVEMPAATFWQWVVQTVLPAVEQRGGKFLEAVVLTSAGEPAE
jgi:ProP effector